MEKENLLLTFFIVVLILAGLIFSSFLISAIGSTNYNMSNVIVNPVEEEMQVLTIMLLD